ncbi:MAG: ABC transporter ATP-binding protein [Pseudomonadota bacterium]
MHLVVSGLTKCFAGVTAVDRASLAVAEGEFVTLLGPSGCGKTTLLRLVAGLVEADAGRVMVAGHDLSGVPAEARGFGFVFQAYALFPTKTVAENIAFPLMLRGAATSLRRQRVDELAQLVSIDDLLDRYPHELSGGQQQRAALARALAMEPPLLLLDEPLSALDARIRQRLRRELRELLGRIGVTALYVTHDQEEALELSDRIVLMDEGRIVQTGTPEEVYLRPATRYAAEFMGRAAILVVEVGSDGSLIPAVGPTVGGVAHDLAPGSRGALCLRPEFVELRPPEGAELEGVVRDARFLGAQTRVWVEGPWVTIVEADVNPRDWRCLGLVPGDRVGLDLRREGLVVLPETAP